MVQENSDEEKENVKKMRKRLKKKTLFLYPKRLFKNDQLFYIFRFGKYFVFVICSCLDRKESENYRWCCLLFWRVSCLFVAKNETYSDVFSVDEFV
jgi:hypothetical protein